jgi:hypothetical protein
VPVRVKKRLSPATLVRLEGTVSNRLQPLHKQEGEKHVPKRQNWYFGKDSFFP